MGPGRYAIAALTLTTAFVAEAAGALSISAAPTQLELAPGARATLRITAPETPTLSVSVGHVEELRAVGPGVFEAAYLPPRETYPQVAIVVATAGQAVVWLPLPLVGTGQVSVKAGRSGAATVTIGNRRFGPRRAGPDGRAVIRIAVPPGVREAVSGGKRLSLNTPDVSHVYVTVGRASVAAGETAAILVRAFAVTPQGKPRRNAPLELEALAGQLTAARAVEPGLFESRWTLPPGLGTATVEARLTDERASVSRAVVRREAAKPRQLKIEVDRASVTAGEGTLDFTVSVEDGAGNPVADVSPRATTSIGTFLGWSRGMPGRWTGHVAVPERLGGDSKLVIVASADDLLERREVSLVPGPTAEIFVQRGGPGPSEGSVALSITTLDRFGNRSDDAPPQATAALGVLESPVRQSVGFYRVVYRPPASPHATRDEVTVRAGRAEGFVRIPLRESTASRLAVAVKGGIAARSGAVAPAVGADATLWGLGSDQVGLQLEGTWFSFSQDKTVTASSSSFPLSSKASYVAFTAAPAWRQPLGGRAMLWGALGGGVVRAGSSSRLGTQPTIDEARWVAAGTASLGVGTRLWGGSPFLEARAMYVADPRLSGLSGSFVPLLLQVGYRFDAL